MSKKVMPPSTAARDDGLGLVLVEDPGTVAVVPEAHHARGTPATPAGRSFRDSRTRTASSSGRRRHRYRRRGGRSVDPRRPGRRRPCARAARSAGATGSARGCVRPTGHPALNWHFSGCSFSETSQVAVAWRKCLLAWMARPACVRPVRAAARPERSHGEDAGDEEQARRTWDPSRGSGSRGGRPSSAPSVIVAVGAGVGIWLATTQLERLAADHHDHDASRPSRPAPSPRRSSSSGTIEPASQASLNFGSVRPGHRRRRHRGPDGHRRAGPGHHRRHLADGLPGPGPGHAGQRPGPAVLRSGRRGLVGPDRLRPGQHRLGPDPGHQRPDRAGRGHPDLDHRRNGGLGRPDRRPAGDRLIRRRAPRAPTPRRRPSGSGTGSTGVVGRAAPSRGAAPAPPQTASSSSSIIQLLDGPGRGGLHRLLHRQHHGRTAPRSAS